MKKWRPPPTRVTAPGSTSSTAKSRSRCATDPLSQGSDEGRAGEIVQERQHKEDEDPGTSADGDQSDKAALLSQIHEEPEYEGCLGQRDGHACHQAHLAG